MFSSPQVLNSHCISAHDTRHFAYPYCTEDFNNNDLLFSHVTKHQIQCNICYEFVLTEDELDQHMRKNHKKEMLTKKQNEEREEENRRELEKQRKHDKREKDRKRRRKEAKRKRKKQKMEEEAEDDEEEDDDENDDDDDDDTYTPGGEDSEKDPTAKRNVRQLVKKIKNLLTMYFLAPLEQAFVLMYFYLQQGFYVLSKTNIIDLRLCILRTLWLYHIPQQLEL